MPPKRKAASKAKSEIAKSIEDSLSNITVRKTKEKTDNVEEMVECEVDKISMFEHTSASVIEKIPNMITKAAVVEISSGMDGTESDGSEIKSKNRVTKSKKKENTKTLKKDFQEEIYKVLKNKKRATSEDRVMIKLEQNLADKNRKRRVDKNSSENPSKPLSPTNIPEKKNRRAVSVDCISTEITSQIPKKNRKIVNDEDNQKKNRKTAKKEQTKTKKIDDESKIVENNENEVVNVEKSTKVKKNVKKQSNEEKENLIKPEHTIEKSPQEKPKSTYKETVFVENEDLVVEDVKKKTKKQPALKNKKIDNKKQKNVANSKPLSSSEKSEDLSDINNTNNSEVNVFNEVKQIKRTRKVKEVDQKNSEDKEIKLPRRNRKIKVDVAQKSSHVGSEDEGNIEAKDLPVDAFLDTPESENNGVKPAVVKRKTRAKTTKK